jgi:crossover junction endodeoxyribonuclease RuvC
MTHSVVGIDPSLTSTGLARIFPNGDAYTDHYGYGLKQDAALTLRGKRIRDVVNYVLNTWVHDDDLVVIESRFGTANSALDLTGLWWAIVNGLQRRDVPVATFAPNSRAKYATGVGKNDKAGVAVAMSRMFPDVEITCSDEADALVLAHVGAAHLGFSVPPAKCPEAAAAAKWPT